jgi:hypothetical protein
MKNETKNVYAAGTGHIYNCGCLIYQNAYMYTQKNKNSLEFTHGQTKQKYLT